MEHVAVAALALATLQGVLGNGEVVLTTGDRAGADEARDIHEPATRAVALARPPIAAAGNSVTFARGDRLRVVYVDGRQPERLAPTPEPATSQEPTSPWTTLSTSSTSTANGTSTS